MDAAPASRDLRARVRLAIQHELAGLKGQITRHQGIAAGLREDLERERGKVARLEAELSRVRAEMEDLRAPADPIEAALGLHGKLLAVLPREHRRLADDIAQPLLQLLAPWLSRGLVAAVRRRGPGPVRRDVTHRAKEASYAP